tara:strand:- start:449 stop:613 length:165 start_codon:yes stop_codon:yes gene_type:complete
LSRRIAGVILNSFQKCESMAWNVEWQSASNSLFFGALYYTAKNGYFKKKHYLFI